MVIDCFANNTDYYFFEILTDVKGGLVNSHNREIQGADSDMVGPKDSKHVIRIQSLFLLFLISSFLGTSRFYTFTTSNTHSRK